ncbi:MAG: glycosyltransferase family 4 protein [Flavobacteriales bacterium]|nr:glycosyltransferase family 4 protein [Flavobacteriales bacterium]
MTRRILYIYPKRSAFIDRDLALLAQGYRIDDHELFKGPPWLLPWWLLMQFLFLIRHTSWKKDVICHFAGYHSVLPSLFSKRCFIILAGSDGASFPHINYGNFRKRLYGWATAFSVRHATRLLPVDASLVESEQTYDPSGPGRQGVKAFVTRLNTPWTVIPYGFDHEKWLADPHVSRDQQTIVCVASGTMPGNAVHYRKGIDLILAIAPLLPKLRFRVIGCPDPTAYAELPGNIEVLAPMNAFALRAAYSEAAFYLQPSIMEGFPNAVCEAMLCGCVPIVSNVAAMPHIVGSSGFKCMKRDAQALMNTIKEAHSDPSQKDRSIAARERILMKFTARHRLDALTMVLTEPDSPMAQRC